MNAKENSVSGTDNTQINSEVEISANKTNSFSKGDIFVSVKEISILNKVDITVGATGIESVTKNGLSTGDRLVFDGNYKYEVRLTKVDYVNQTISVIVNRMESK